MHENLSRLIEENGYESIPLFEMRGYVAVEINDLWIFSQTLTHGRYTLETTDQFSDEHCYARQSSYHVRLELIQLDPASDVAVLVDDKVKRERNLQLLILS